MKKVILFTIILLASFIAFIGCSDKKNMNSSDELKYPETKYNKVCIDGVVYLEAYKRIAPYINPKTLTFIRCKDYIKMQKEGKK